MTKSPEQRAAALLQEMTLEEKAQQLTAVMPFGLMNVDGPSREQLSSELETGIGQVSMLAMFSHLPPAGLAHTANTIQRYLVEETRLGIPAIIHLEAINGLVARGFTTFPTAIGLAATWNPEAVERMARVIARQMRAVGHAQALSPVMDVARDPRWGRVHETYGEDPYLVSAFSVAYTRGLQGDDLTSGALATGKHFLGFGMTDGGQHMASTTVGGREVREVYARPFEAAIREAGLGSIMNSYSTVDGIPVGANRPVLDHLLRDELGFTGTVVSDYGTIANLFDRQGVAKDLKDAGRLALEAGLDVELPDAKGYGATLVQAVREGLVPEGLVDRSVLRVLRDKFALGLFDDPYVSEDESVIASVAVEGSDLAVQLARESVTLLRNDENLLPLSKATRRIAVIGPHAETIDVSFPGYTYFASLAMMAGAAQGEQSNMAGTEDAGQSALNSGTMAALGAQLGPILARGLDAFARETYGAMTLTDAIRLAAPDADVISVDGCGVLDDEPADLDAAITVAESADLVILALGGRPGWFGTRVTEGEGSDRADIDLPHIQVSLAEAIAATGKPTVGIVFTGRPFALAGIAKVLPTLIYPFYGGQAGMSAVAEVLFGDVNPSGKLPLSLPRHSGQVPLHHGQHLGTGYRRTNADAHKGYTDTPSTPLFPFGHGLSYTSFDYTDLRVSDSIISTNGSVTASVTITNTGDRSGTEVVQFYASHRAELVTRPAQELIGFLRVDLAPGEVATIEIAFSTGQLAYLGRDNQFVFDSGALDLSVGSSSEDLRLSETIETIGTAADWSEDRPLFPSISRR
ncbi:glycoside hydrolase family 3 N-terminal domain-containing protein [Leifsonia poae]|uniref:glycoside hydrolase family 3 N-terminal domain-containing protein n=1 Tax=Leifsonia poae TaxID=110933 RepID=UPI001CBB0441|nr:glycoside hydrolase family 3 N-terminal domain-containing protein [Leifsonia poae]